MNVHVPDYVREAVEQVAFAARDDARVDGHSGVSQRLPISLLEAVVSNAEQRALVTGQDGVVARIRDLYAGLPAVTGKLELAYEGELRGAETIARDLVRNAIGRTFDAHGKDVEADTIVDWFESDDRVFRLPDDEDAGAWWARMKEIPHLQDAATALTGGKDATLRAAAGEFILEGLHAKRRLGRSEERGYRALDAEARGAATTPTRWN